MRKNIFTIISLFLFSIHSIGQSDVKVYDNFDKFKKYEIKGVDKNTVKIINFWATWCVPCVKELPYFEAIDNTEVSGVKIDVLLTSLDFEKNKLSRVIPFINKKQIKSKVVMLTDSDTNSWIDKIEENWSGSIPATYILYKGNAYFFEKDYHNKEELELEIKTIIKNN